MKIGFDTAPASPAGSYLQDLAKVLARYAPQHEYLVGGKHRNEVDLYHGFHPSLPLSVRLMRVKSVVTVGNLNFLRYPHLYSLTERLFVLGACRRSLRSAGRVITFNTPAREELSRRLKIDPERIEVVLPLAARVPLTPPADEQLAAVRRKYSLPERFVLMLGTVEPRHNHATVLEALFAAEKARGPAAASDTAATHATAGSVAGQPVSVVICGRRTAYSDFLLDYARRHHLATRVEFIYELAPRDLPALFRLAHAFVYLPDADAEASIVPVVEAMRARLPLLLSDTAVNREAAGDAALYADPERVETVADALGRMLDDEAFRRGMQEREGRRAELFSEYAVAERLMQIYTSL